MYEAYGPGKYDLPDQGFIAKVHPLDLWMLGYLLKNPARPSRTSSTPAVSNARRSTAGCSRAAPGRP
jgi:hypothetical protein